MATEKSGGTATASRAERLSELRDLLEEIEEGESTAVRLSRQSQGKKLVVRLTSTFALKKQMYGFGKPVPRTILKGEVIETTETVLQDFCADGHTKETFEVLPKKEADEWRAEKEKARNVKFEEPAETKAAEKQGN